MFDLKELVSSALIEARHTYLKLAERGEAAKETSVGAFGDLSTLSDIICEEVIMEKINSQLKDVSFITEEKGVLGDIGHSKYLVLIDPIDGSTNMKRGLRFFSSGIAIFNGLKYENLVATGVIDIPEGQLFLADKNGVYLKDRAPSLSSIKSLEKAVVSLDFRPLKRGGESATTFVRLCQTLRHFRNLGSSLLEICQIINGKIDAFICLTSELRLFDILPALFILEKAGGHWLMNKPISVLNESTIKDRYAVIAASNKDLLNEIISIASIKWPTISDEIF